MSIEQHFTKLSPLYAAILLTALFFLMLVHYVNKAFHIDDPLFIWTAKHIRTEPLDFYNFNVNWNGTMTILALWRFFPCQRLFISAYGGIASGRLGRASVSLPVQAPGTS